MAPSFYACHTPYCSLCHSFYGNLTANSTRIAQDSVKSLVEKLAKSAFIDNSKDTITPIYIGTPVPSCTLIPASALIFNPISTKKIFKQFMKIYKVSIKVLG